VSVYSKSVPRHWLWWALQAGSAGLMILGGVWGCRVRELRPLSFGGGGKTGVGGRGDYEMVGRVEGDGEGG